MVNMDMRKAFDTIAHLILIRALRSRELPETYKVLLSINVSNCVVIGISNLKLKKFQLMKKF